MQIPTRIQKCALCNEPPSYYLRTLIWKKLYWFRNNRSWLWIMSVMSRSLMLTLSGPRGRFTLTSQSPRAYFLLLLMWMSSFFSPVSHTLRCGSLITFNPLPFHRAHCLPSLRCIFQTCCNLFVFIVIWVSCPVLSVRANKFGFLWHDVLSVLWRTKLGSTQIILEANTKI